MKIRDLITYCDSYDRDYKLKKILAYCDDDGFDDKQHPRRPDGRFLPVPESKDAEETTDIEHDPGEGKKPAEGGEGKKPAIKGLSAQHQPRHHPIARDKVAGDNEDLVVVIHGFDARDEQEALKEGTEVMLENIQFKVMTVDKGMVHLKVIDEEDEEGAVDETGEGNVDDVEKEEGEVSNGRNPDENPEEEDEETNDPGSASESDDGERGDATTAGDPNATSSSDRPQR